MDRWLRARERKGTAVETIVRAGLSNAVAATVLALVVACLARPLARRPAILHCLWLLVLLKLVTPPLYEVPISWPDTLTASTATHVEAEPGAIDWKSSGYFLEVAENTELISSNDQAAQ